LQGRPEEKGSEESEVLMEKVKQLLGSRKFWAALIGLVLVMVKVWRPDFPMDEEQLVSVVYVLVAYILGTGIEDGLSRKEG
jgi:hypothetical protein